MRWYKDFFTFPVIQTLWKCMVGIPIEGWKGSAFGKASMIFVAKASISSFNKAFLDNWLRGLTRVWWALTCIQACLEVFVWIEAWRWLSRSQCAHRAFMLSRGAMHLCKVERESHPVRRIGAGDVKGSNLLTSWTIPVTPAILLRNEHCASGGPWTIPPPSMNSIPFSDSILQAKEPFIHWGAKEPLLPHRVQPLEKSWSSWEVVSDWFTYWCVQYDNGDEESTVCCSWVVAGGKIVNLSVDGMFDNETWRQLWGSPIVTTNPTVLNDKVWVDRPIRIREWHVQDWVGWRRNSVSPDCVTWLCHQGCTLLIVFCFT